METKNLNLSRTLAECVYACNTCFNACLEEKDVEMMKECIKLDKECVTVCAATLQLVYTGSHFTKEVLALCEKVCKSCADECRKHPEEHCQKCAKACDECAKACREFR